uniref:peptidoglycan D,D-transpeptidase FtsI family protein n=1 Tax=Elioraea rosea TaxID=2492390 RepID=UPI0011863F95
RALTPWRGAKPPAPIVADGRRRAQLDRARARLMVGAGLFGILYLAVAARLADATVFTGQEPRQSTPPVAAIDPEPPVSRASITDRNGVILAVSLPTVALYANPRQIIDPAEAAKALAGVLPGLDVPALTERLSGERSFVYIRRHLAPREQDAVNRLGIPGLYFERAERRVYPQGRAAVHVLGGTDVDGNGIAGVERFFDQRLREAPAEPVTLSIDVRVQHVLREAIAGAIARFDAIGGAGVVMDVRSGEVIGMVSLPDYLPGDVGTATNDQRFNRITVGVYEPGSTFKLITTGMALELGTTTIWGGYDASRPIRQGRFTISDFKGKNRWLTVPEIFAYSSNIGTAKMALDVGVPRHRAFVERMGLLSRPGIELAEVAAPLYPRGNTWREINTLTISYGHGISISPLAVATATAAMVNGGVLHRPTILAREPQAPARGTRVIRTETSDTLRRLMRLAVTEGTGKGADVPGYFVGGKTGTAQKVGPRGGYLLNARISSFTGIFPSHDPRYVVYLMVDEPKGRRDTAGYATGGWVAAPAAQEVISQVGPILGIQPQPETDALKAALVMPLQPARPARATAAAPQRAAAQSVSPAGGERRVTAH